MFAAPQPPTPDQTTSTATPTPSVASPFLEDDADQLVQTTGPRYVRGERVGDSPAAPRTATSSATREPRDFAALTRGVLRALTAGAAAILINVGRQLRRPDADQLDAIARPLASILVRHLPIEKLGDDLLDLADLGGGIAEYAADGPIAPLIYPPVVHVGMEHGDPPAPPPDAPARVASAVADPVIETPPPAGGVKVTYAE